MATNSCLKISFAENEFSNLIEPNLTLFRNSRGKIDWVAVIRGC